jgi:hypothetical protein
MGKWDFAGPINCATSEQNRVMLNIVIDKQIIVTNTCYIEVGWIVVSPNASAGRPLISKRGGFRQIV